MTDRIYDDGQNQVFTATMPLRDNALQHKMLKADQIELFILNLLVNWTDPQGRSLDLGQIHAACLQQIADVSRDELTDALILLTESQFISAEEYP